VLIENVMTAESKVRLYGVKGRYHGSAIEFLVSALSHCLDAGFLTR